MCGRMEAAKRSFYAPAKIELAEVFTNSLKLFWPSFLFVPAMEKKHPLIISARVEQGGLLPDLRARFLVKGLQAGSLQILLSYTLSPSLVRSTCRPDLSDILKCCLLVVWFFARNDIPAETAPTTPGGFRSRLLHSLYLPSRCFLNL